MKNLAIFASGNGSNFENIVKSNLNCNIKVLICNNANAFVISRAKKLNINYKVICSEDYNSRGEFEEEILNVLKLFKIDLIVLAGYMKIFSSKFVSLYPESIINIHPSKLPKYPGLNAIKRAYDAGEKEVGVSVHYVDCGVDTGRVIACESVCIEAGDTFVDVENKVHQKEYQLYPKVLEEIL